MLAWLLGPYVQHMREEIAWLKQALIHERTRAERAIDAMLMLRVPGAVPITPTPSEVRDANTVAPEESPQQTVTRLLGDEEFQNAGRV